MGNRLYVANVPFAVTSERLAEHFSQIGTVTNVQLMLDKITGRPRGIAFVTMGSDDDARNAIDRLNGQPFEGRPLTVNEARPREDRAGGGPPRRSFDAGGPVHAPGGGTSGGSGAVGGGGGGGSPPRRTFGPDRRPDRAGGGRSDRGGRKDRERDSERERSERRARRQLDNDDDDRGGRHFARGDFGDDDDE
jgi:RNA recognition motif-containing protein